MQLLIDAGARATGQIGFFIMMVFIISSKGFVICFVDVNTGSSKAFVMK